MSWEIYQKDKFLDDLGSSANVGALLDLKSDTINEFIENANTPEGADADLVNRVISELSGHQEWDWLVAILKKARPPIIISNGTESWIKERFPNEEWLEPE